MIPAVEFESMVVRTERTRQGLHINQHVGVVPIELDIAGHNADSLHCMVQSVSAGLHPQTTLIPAGRQPCGDRFFPVPVVRIRCGLRPQPTKNISTDFTVYADLD